MTLKQKWLLVGIIVLAVFFRFYKIVEMPGGLFPDEAANGLDINLMQHGQVQPFYERGNGREALFFYFLWASVEIFGKGPWQHHIVSALIGVLSVLICFFITRKLFSISFPENYSRHNSNDAIIIALLASFFMAVSTWHVVLSRTAFRAILIPLATSITLYVFLRLISEHKRHLQYVWAIAFGVVGAAGFYTYIAYRMMAPLLFLVALWPLFAIPRKEIFIKLQQYKFLILLCFSVFAICIAPLGWYFYHHPDFLIGRSGQVSIFNPDLNMGHLLPTFLEVTRQSLLAFFTKGDLNWRHNISSLPFLSILISPFFAVGLLASTGRALRYMFSPRRFSYDWRYWLLALWFWTMLAPVISTAEGIPHGLRSMGVIPSIFIMAAHGLFLCANGLAFMVRSRHEYSKRWKVLLVHKAFIFAFACFVIALPLQSYFLYFVYAGNSPENYYAFRSDLTVVSEYLNTQASKNNTYLILDKFSIQTVDYLTSPHNQPYKQVDPENAWQLNALKPNDKIVFTESSLFDIKKFKQYHPDTELILETRNKFNQTIMAVYKITNNNR